MKCYPYQIYYPESYDHDPEQQWPLIVFLHGSGERGKNPEKVKQQGLPKLLSEKPDLPFVVAYPQCPTRNYWNVQVLNNWLDEVLEKTRTDHTRIYLTGISMGGYGTWHWATAHPERFAAIAPICGGGDPTMAHRLSEIPTWAFHGAKDDIVPIDETLEMVAALKAIGGNVKLTIYPDLYHDCWTRTYSTPEVYDWFLKQRNGRNSG